MISSPVENPSRCGVPQSTRLIVLRGNSGSGKSTVAQAVRDCYGRGVAVVAQDNIRRTVLRERDAPGAANIGLIGGVARYALDHGYHVVVEGIMYADRYAGMLRGLCGEYRGRTRLYYLDVSFDETLRRHATRPLAAEFGGDEMRAWYRPADLLPGGVEEVVPQTSTLAQTVARVMGGVGLEPRG